MLSKRQPGEVEVRHVSVMVREMEFSVVAVQRGICGGMSGGVFIFYASVSVQGNGMREVNREGFDGPLGGGEGSGVFDDRSKGFVGKGEKAFRGGFELVRQLFGAKRLMCAPSRVK